MSNALKENWRPIPGYEGSYSVSDLGRVRSEARTVIRKNGVKLFTPERILALSPEKSGHLRFFASMGADGVKRVAVHKAVMEAFEGPCPEGCEVRHRGGNPANNAYTNLLYGTRAQNIEDAKGHGTFSEAEIHPVAILSNEQALTIYNTVGVAAADIAEQYGVHVGVVNQIWRGDTWKSVTGGANVIRQRGRKTYLRTRLTAEQAAFALANRASRTGRKDGKGRYPTAAALGVDPDVISALYAAIDAGKTIIYAE